MRWSQRRKRTTEFWTARLAKDAGEACGSMGMDGGAEQGERAFYRDALLTKARRRRSGGRAAKADALILADLALYLKG